MSDALVPSIPIVRVALDVPLHTLFDYFCVDATEADIGRRAVVPFRAGTAVGVIVAVTATAEIALERVKAVQSVLRDTPPLPATWLELARFCSDYYQKPMGE